MLSICGAGAASPRLWAILALVASACESPASAQAAPDDGGLVLAWDAPEGCPDHDTVLARVRAHDPVAFGKNGAALSASARVARLEQRFELTLRVDGPGAATAERTLQGDSCDAVADAAALLIALALQHDEQHGSANGAVEPGTPSATTSPGAGGPEAARTGAPAQQDQASSTRSTNAAPGTPATRDDATEPGKRARLIEIAPDNEVVERSRPLALAFGLGAALAIDAGMLPRAPAFGPQLRVQLQVERFRISAGYSMWLARRGESQGYRSAQLDGHGSIGDVAFGVDLLRSRLRLGAAVLFELGSISLQAHGISAPAPASATWIAAGAGLQLAYPIGAGFEAFLDAGGLLPFAPPRWKLHTPAGAVDLFGTSPLVLHAATGFGYVFQ